MNAPRLLGLGTSIALHAGVLAILVWGVWHPAPASVNTAATPARVAVPDSPVLDVPEAGFPLPGSLARSELHIGGFRFDYRKIAERRTQLFPFVTRSLPLERTTATVQYVHRGSAMNALAPVTVDPAARPLVLSEKELQRLVDEAWSRRERWQPFRRIAALVTAHAADDARVLALLRAYQHQNVLQPYIDTSRDAALWVMLGISADHSDFIDFVAEYAAHHPSSRVTTELLFLLDELAQGSYDALSVLLDTRGHELWWTREANREAYDLFVALQQHYRVQLGRIGVRREDLGAYYEKVRLSILSHIVRITPGGYRINDAWFLTGSIYWNQGRSADALEVWRQMTVNPGDVYADASFRLKGALHGSADVDATTINRILEEERSRWLEFSARRLARFGYDVDTF